MSIVSVEGLGNYRGFYSLLGELPHRIAHDLVAALRDDELELRDRDEWLSSSQEHRAPMLAALATKMPPEHARLVEQRYIDFRLRVRPLALVAFGLYLRSPDFIRECVTLQGAAVLRGLQEAGKACILAGAHFGPYSAVPLVLATLGFPCTVVVSQAELELVRRLVAQHCPKAAVEFLGVPDRRILVRCRQRLQAGRNVLMFAEASESDAPIRTVVNFFGRRVCAPEGPVALSAISGAPLVLAFMLCDEPRRYRLVLDDPIFAPGRAWHDIQNCVRTLWERLEFHVAKHPEQWVGWELLADRMLEAVQPSRVRQIVQAAKGQSGNK